MNHRCHFIDRVRCAGISRENSVRVERGKFLWYLKSYRASFWHEGTLRADCSVMAKKKDRTVFQISRSLLVYVCARAYVVGCWSIFTAWREGGSHNLSTTNQSNECISLDACNNSKCMNKLLFNPFFNELYKLVSRYLLRWFVLFVLA